MTSHSAGDSSSFPYIVSTAIREPLLLPSAMNSLCATSGHKIRPSEDVCDGYAENVPYGVIGATCGMLAASEDVSTSGGVLQSRELDACGEVVASQEMLTYIDVARASGTELGVTECDRNLHEKGTDNVVGKVFADKTAAYNFYNNYALSHGFGIRIKCTHKKWATNEIFRMIYVCNKEGFKDLKEKRSLGINVKRRRDTRTGCEAMLRISKQQGDTWIVDKFEDFHNHPLIHSPKKILKHRSHSKFHKSEVCKSLVSSLNESGLRPSQISKAVNVLSGEGAPNIRAGNVQSMLAQQRKNHVGRECIGIVKYFQEKASADPSFYFSMDLDDFGALRNIFWADGRSRLAYKTFGDVLVFDVTYKTNKYKMPFAPFVGVNHHRQSILLGAALLEDETESTFLWVFQQFLTCMCGRKPVSIITDQDKAMTNAIAKVFPDVRHRFCAWHIMKHFTEHLQHYRSRDETFQQQFTDVVKSQTIEEFEEKWSALVMRHNIEPNSWLGRTYKLRRFWGKAFLRDTFFAGMTTSGRSESINSFFDGYVNSKTTLNDFVLQYDKALTSRRDLEEDEDFRSMNSNSVHSSHHPIEVKAGQCYTRNIFEIFRKEWLETLHCGHETISKDFQVITYKVGALNLDRSKWRTVQYNALNLSATKCSCAKYETFRILCKHILYVMKKKNIMTLPDDFILRRWCLDARFNFCETSLKHTMASEANSLSLWSINMNYLKVMQEAMDVPSDLKMINDFFIMMINDQRQRKIQCEQQKSTIHELNIENEERIKDPSGYMKVKGRPRTASRLQSGLEIQMSEKKKISCSYCHQRGHYVTGCLQKKANDATL